MLTQNIEFDFCAKFGLSPMPGSKVPNFAFFAKGTVLSSGTRPSGAFPRFVLDYLVGSLFVSFIARGISVAGRLITILLVLVAELAICILAHPFKDAIDSHLDSGLREGESERN